MFKTVIKQRPFLFCCVLASFLLAIIQAATVHAATQQTQSPTVAQAGTTLVVTPTTVPAGGTITVTGDNWLPPQQLTLEVTPSGQPNNILTQTIVTSNTTGHFSTTVTSAIDAPAGTYTVSVSGTNPPNALKMQTDFTITTATVSLTQAGQDPPTGHPGTKVTIDLKSFPPSKAVDLFMTTDTTQCVLNGQGLQPFTTPVTTDATGNANIPSINWPDNFNQAGAKYYVCAITETNPALYVLSTQSFTVAQPVTITATPTTVKPGNPVTITGDYWLPPQQITVQIAANGQSDVLVQDTTTPNSNGHFSITLTIPANTPAGTYMILAYATNENALHSPPNTTITIGTLTPTATASPSATVSPTASPSATATSAPGASNGGGSGGSGLTVVIIILGGLGALLVLVGIIMFAASTPPAPTH